MKKVNFHVYNNFIIFNYIYTFTLFKKSKNNLNHLNVTKIKMKENIINVKKIIFNFFKRNAFNLKIDNIIATSDYKRPIILNDLHQFKIFPCMKYNPEVFPGLFIKFEKNTCILFHSGKIVILGSKTKKDIKITLQHIVQSLNKYES